jgi:hypothetical protein
MTEQRLMLDLCCGLGGASAAMRAAGWEVVTLDNDPRFEATITTDIRSWSWPGRTPDLVWASPPCTEFSRESMPWSRTGKTPDMSIVLACVRIIKECRPRLWVIENVRGAAKYFKPVLGKYRQTCGPFFLWGNFLPFVCRVRPFKEKLSSTKRAERAKVPWKLSDAIRRQAEQVELFA